MSRTAPAVPLLATDRAGAFRLTGLDLEGFWALAHGRRVTVFAPRLLAGQVRARLPGRTVIADDRLVSALARFCRARRWRSVGVDFAALSHALALRLGAEITLRDAGERMRALRMVKTPAEIAAIRAACSLAVRAFRYARRFTVPGSTEKHIAFKIEEFFARNGVRPSFPTIVAAGPNSADPHHISSNRKILKNDIILIDLGCVYNGYCSDLTRTFAIGKINYLYKAVHALVARAHRETVRMLAPRVMASAADGVARGIITAAGYGDRFIHTTGHGVGIEIHEAPRLSGGDRTVLRAGMVVTVEPGVYLPGKFGVRIEDTVLVTNNSREELTR